MTELAGPGKPRRQIGPHVVEPRNEPVSIGASPYCEPGEYDWQWVCKYCGEANVTIAGFAHIPSGCDDIEWLDSELVKMRAER